MRLAKHSVEAPHGAPVGLLPGAHAGEDWQSVSAQSVSPSRSSSALLLQLDSGKRHVVVQLVPLGGSQSSPGSTRLLPHTAFPEDAVPLEESPADDAWVDVAPPDDVAAADVPPPCDEPAWLVPPLADEDSVPLDAPPDEEEEDELLLDEELLDELLEEELLEDELLEDELLLVPPDVLLELLSPLLDPCVGHPVNANVAPRTDTPTMRFSLMRAPWPRCVSNRAPPSRRVIETATLRPSEVVSKAVTARSGQAEARPLLRRREFQASSRTREKYWPALLALPMTTPSHTRRRESSRPWKTR
jgi:hypothetical protein